MTDQAFPGTVWINSVGTTRKIETETETERERSRRAREDVERPAQEESERAVQQEQAKNKNTQQTRKIIIVHSTYDWATATGSGRQIATRKYRVAECKEKRETDKKVGDKREKEGILLTSPGRSLNGTCGCA